MKAPASDEIVEVTITLDLKGARDRFDEIVRMLEQNGLADADLHARFGIVNGRVPASRIKALQQIAGVLSVRRDRTYGPQSK
jgi:hypothetical protein